MKTVKISLPTIHCESCVKLIEITLKTVKGVNERKYDIPGRSAEIRFDESVVSANEIVDAIKNDAGYEAELEGKESDPDEDSDSNPPAVLRNAVGS